ncbi:MAG: bifunctional demethylmenaquinone methyltransferase/2-methoxy-6-polyprenyl-1,4-benzoquinol methylase UbiE [Anaerolineae bacterium]
MSTADSAEQKVTAMFNAIAQTYDRLNRILSLGIDRSWRKRMLRFLPKQEILHLLDLATGTADQLIFLLDHVPTISAAAGLDPAQEMLLLGRQKLQSKSYGERVVLKEGHAAQIPYNDETFDCITISFGVRNFSNLPVCLKEIYRVLKKGGRLLILEFSTPPLPFIRRLYLFYLRHVLPRLGSWLSKNQTAYLYLNETIESFPSGLAFCRLLDDAGLKGAQAHPLSFGIVTIYQADK